MNLSNLMPGESRKKISRLLCVTALSTCSVFAYAQQQQQVKLTGSNLPLKSVFKQIEKQTDLSIDYRSQDVDDSRIVKQMPKATTVQQAMNQLLAGTDCVVTFSNGHIIIKKQASNTTNQQSKRVKGIIVDATGMPVIGANVMVKGTTNGTITDMDGRFSLDVPNDAVLEVSYIGYSSQIIKVGGQNSLNITLKEDTQALDEVVVVGYGVQKRASVTGSVAALQSKDIATVKTPNVTNALAGKLPGLRAVQRSGAPGDDAASIDIRGFGNALVIVDGVERDFTQIDANDIESISILKDASAAVYGFKGANGVILVTTKKGEISKPTISYNGYYGFQQVTRFPELYDAYEYASLWNEAQMNIGVAAPYSKEDLEKYKSGSDPAYPNTNWWDSATRNSAPQMYHNLSVSGGAEKVKYYFSLGYTNQEGIWVTKDHNYKKYNVRSNISAEIVKGLTVGLQLSGRLDNRVNHMNKKYLKGSILQVH